MSTVLYGFWDWAGDLTVTHSHTIQDGDSDSDGDREAIDAVIAALPANAWACTFPVDTHSEAVQRAYEEYCRDEEGRLIDEVHGFEPVTG
ncbi:hypothetical protein [Streptomyces sp. NPDC059991]|uniref:hypothetical protein n=1 Tax=unclassified Streptomyces TaxID=2593676 RepID=UPI0036A84E86